MWKIFFTYRHKNPVPINDTHSPYAVQVFRRRRPSRVQAPPLRPQPRLNQWRRLWNTWTLQIITMNWLLLWWRPQVLKLIWLHTQQLQRPTTVYWKLCPIPFLSPSRIKKSSRQHLRVVPTPLRLLIASQWLPKAQCKIFPRISPFKYFESNQIFCFSLQLLNFACSLFDYISKKLVKMQDWKMSGILNFAKILRHFIIKNLIIFTISIIVYKNHLNRPKQAPRNPIILQHRNPCPPFQLRSQWRPPKIPLRSVRFFLIFLWFQCLWN